MPAATIYDVDVEALDGRSVSLGSYRGRVLLIVNVASRCGYTPQYRGLEALHRRYQNRGLSVLGFPCNQFGEQEPGTNDDIAAFCAAQYDVTFPVFAKIDVNGEREHPLYTFLKAARRGFLGWQAIKWNFTKFIVDRQGLVVGRYGSRATPASLEPVLEAALGSTD